MTLRCTERLRRATRQPPARAHCLRPGGVRIGAEFTFRSTRWRSMRRRSRSRGARLRPSSPFVEVTSYSTVSAW